MKLSNGYEIRVLKHGARSPMQNHGPMEIATDQENRVFYIYEVMLTCYGTDSVIKACETYPVPVEA